MLIQQTLILGARLSDLRGFPRSRDPGLFSDLDKKPLMVSRLAHEQSTVNCYSVRVALFLSKIGENKM